MSIPFDLSPTDFPFEHYRRTHHKQDPDSDGNQKFGPGITCHSHLVTTSAPTAVMAIHHLPIALPFGPILSLYRRTVIVNEDIW